MTINELLPQLSGVRHTSRGILALCPSHPDRHPSLSVREGDRGLLLRCWAGCPTSAIVATLGLKLSDLFYDALPDRTAFDKRRRIREHQQAERTAAQHRLGIKNDLLREAEHFIRTARGLDINTWSDTKLDAVLDRLGDAYAILWEHDHAHAV
jgi:hypothetical protein